MKSASSPRLCTNWSLVLLLFAAACTSTFHIGKVPAALPQLSLELDLSLVESSLIVALFSVLIGIFGLLTGLFASKIGYRTAALVGLTVGGVASMAGSDSDSLAQLLIWRSMEGIGWVFTAVAIPVLMVNFSQPRDRPLVLGIFGAFVPTGVVIALLVSPWVLAEAGWRGLWQLTGVISLLAAFALYAATRGGSIPSAVKIRTGHIKSVVFRAAPILMGLCFLLYSALFVSVTSFMPTLMLAVHHISIQMAATLGAVVVSGNIVGNISAGWFLRRGVSRYLMLMIAMIVMGAMAIVVFGEFASLSGRVVAGVAFVTAGGLVPGTLLATAPLVVREPSQVGLINGFILQAAGIGQLVGPPIMTKTVELGQGWAAASVFTGAVAFIGLMAAWYFSRVVLLPSDN